MCLANLIWQGNICTDRRGELNHADDACSARDFAYERRSWPRTLRWISRTIEKPSLAACQSQTWICRLAVIVFSFLRLHVLNRSQVFSSYQGSFGE